MKDYDNSLLALLSAEEAILGTLVSIQISDALTQFISSFDMDLVYGGNTYSKGEIRLTPLNYSTNLTVDAIKLQLSAVDLSWPAIVLNNNLLNKEVYVYFAGYTRTTNVIAEPLFRGFITKWDLDEESLTLIVSNEIVFWNKKTLRKPDVLCQWGFGEIECGYTGDLSPGCNKTYTQCETYGQTSNFGGCRFVESIEEKDIWWGKRRA